MKYCTWNHLFISNLVEYPAYWKILSYALNLLVKCGNILHLMTVTPHRHNAQPIFSKKAKDHYFDRVLLASFSSASVFISFSLCRHFDRNTWQKISFKQIWKVVGKLIGWPNFWSIVVMIPIKSRNVQTPQLYWILGATYCSNLIWDRFKRIEFECLFFLRRTKIQFDWSIIN